MINIMDVFSALPDRTQAHIAVRDEKSDSTRIGSHPRELNALEEVVRGVLLKARSVLQKKRQQQFETFLNLFGESSRRALFGEIEVVCATILRPQTDTGTNRPRSF